MINKTPLVSISCITYNHQSFIRECLDSFLMQKTTFNFEVIIHDDCSTDGTKEIIEEYASKYPDIFFPIYQKENQFSNGINPALKFNYPRCKGKYIALCEGDDYWTDPLKLQTQVDFLEINLQYSGSAHLVKVVNSDHRDWCSKKLFKNHFEEEDLWLNEIIDIETPFHTSSVIFRKEVVNSIIKYSNRFNKSMSGDLVTFVLMCKHGKVKMFYKEMSIYRLHESGITVLTKHEGSNNLFILNRYFMWHFLRKEFDKSEWGYFSETLSYFDNLLIKRAKTLKMKIFLNFCLKILTNGFYLLSFRILLGKFKNKLK